jgi:hypothetical protein
MRTVQDLVNNFLNNMQMFRLEAEDGPLSAESLQLFDTLIFETSEQITALGASEAVREIQMASGIGIQAQPGLAIRNTPFALAKPPPATTHYEQTRYTAG